MTIIAVFTSTLVIRFGFAVYYLVAVIGGFERKYDGSWATFAFEYLSNWPMLNSLLECWMMLLQISFDLAIWRRHFAMKTYLSEIVKQDALTHRYINLVLYFGICPALPVIYMQFWLLIRNAQHADGYSYLFWMIFVGTTVVMVLLALVYKQSKSMEAFERIDK